MGGCRVGMVVGLEVVGLEVVGWEVVGWEVVGFGGCMGSCLGLGGL